MKIDTHTKRNYVTMLDFIAFNLRSVINFSELNTEQEEELHNAMLTLLYHAGTQEQYYGYKKNNNQ